MRRKKENIPELVLCELSGLTPSDVEKLGEAHLLMPDYSDGTYRPKNLIWAKKLAYLLKTGWSLEQIRAWADGRWKTSNPRKWPPNRDDWQPFKPPSC